MRGATGALPGLGPLAWLAGVAWQLQQAMLPGTGALWALVAAGVLLLVAGCVLRHRAQVTGLVLVLVGLALLGYGSTAWRGAQRLTDRLAPMLEGQDLWLTGRVAGLPQPTPQGTRFVFEVEAAEAAGVAPGPVPRRVMLSWYHAHAADAAADGEPSPGAEADLRAGQRWRLPVRLRRPHGNVNPHGFDYELWLFEQGVRATGYVRVRGDRPPRLLVEHAGHAVHRVHRLRQQVRERIAATVGHASAAGVLAALAVGDQGAIELENDIKDINC